MDRPIGCCRTKFWLWGVFGLIILELILLIVTLAVDEWVKQGDTDEAYEWIGSIDKVIKVDSDFDELPEEIEDWEGDTYTSIATTDECDFFSSSYSRSGSGSSTSVSSDDNEICKQFEKLRDASGVYIAFSVFAMIFLLIAGIFIAISAQQKVTTGHGYSVVIIIMLALSIAAHVIAFAVWHGLVDPKMSGNCEDLTTPDSKESVCAGTGTQLTVVDFVLHLLAGILGIFTSARVISMS
jgi:ABC-type sugar transport system permease subunit